MNGQANSDGLPYMQIDRSVKPKAATLATVLGVTYQHALGSLTEFWEACGEPRELEHLCQDGKEEVVLSRDEVAGRLLAAFGVPVEPDTCRYLGLLEVRPEGFRVRGMSRYFGPIRARLIARNKASAGGKASAAARQKKYGTAQPSAPDPAFASIPAKTGPNAPDLGSNPSSGPPPPFDPKPTKNCSVPSSNQSRTSPEPKSNAFEGVAEPDPNPLRTPPKSTVSGQRSLKEKEEEEEDSSSFESSFDCFSKLTPLSSTLAKNEKETADPTEEKFSSGESFFAFFQRKRFEVGLVPENPPRAPLSRWWSTVLIELTGSDGFQRLEAAVYRYADSKHWQDANPPVPFVGFMSQWRSFVPQKHF